MTNYKKFLYWEDIAQYDLETAQALLDAHRYLYVVFMCQQTIEKLVKGLYVLYNGNDPAKTHNINFIFSTIRWGNTSKHFSSKVSDYKRFFVVLRSYYIAQRYPLYDEKLSTSLDRKEAFEVLEKTKEVFSWLISLKK